MMENKNKIILDLCGGSGSWSKPYKDAGYDVRLITIPEYDVTMVSLTPENITFLQTHNSNERMVIPLKDVYGVLVAPPCTEFSLAKTTAPREFEKGMVTVKACIEIIWHIQTHSKLQFWALENPTCLLRRFLGNPNYSFRQWWFGNDRNKPTDLWGRFNEPKRLHLVKPEYVVKSAHNRNADWYSNSSAAKRAVTPEGFAKAFMKANR